MCIFISHSFEDKPEFDNVAEALSAVGVPYWNPANVKAGASLRDQLRGAVEQCAACIFVATRRSLQSSWCGAELGAFWGAGKTVIVYLAEASLEDDQLPQIVQGDVWERRLKRVADRAKELATISATGDVADDGTPRVANMTIDQLKRLIVGAVSLAQAQTKDDSGGAGQGIGEAATHAAARVLEGIRAADATHVDDDGEWRTRVLWVDDRPNNNTYERAAFAAMGIRFVLAQSTQEALTILSTQRFAAIISDMGRREGPREGYALLGALRATDAKTPFFIYAGSRAPEHVQEAMRRGAQGCTNRPRELLDMVVRALHREAA